MVRISKFFGKDGENDKQNTAQPQINQPPGQASEHHAVFSQKPVSASCPAENHEQAEDVKQLYRRALLFVRQYSVDLVTNPRFIDQKILDIAHEFVEHIAQKQTGLFIMTETTTLDSLRYSHAVNTAIIALTLAQGLGYPFADLEDVGLLGLVHHLGLFGDEGLVFRPAMISSKQVNIIKEGADGAADAAELIKHICCPSASFQKLVEHIMSQPLEHQGIQRYPKKLSQKQLREYTGIIMISDVYETLTHSKPDQARLLPHIMCKWFVEAWQEITNHDKFCNSIIRAWIETIGIYPLGSYVMLSTGEIGRVMSTDKSFPLRPAIDVILTSKGERLQKPRHVILSAMPLISIKEAIDETTIKITDKKFLLSLNVRRWWTE